jgi:hypothetical protein
MPKSVITSPQELHQQQQMSDYFKGVARRDSPSTIVHEMLVERGEVRSADSPTDCCFGTDLWGCKTLEVRDWLRRLRIDKVR